jgi:hypothetical protein
MMVAVIAIVFGMCASSSYGQNDSCVMNAVFCNESTGYQIGSTYVLQLTAGANSTAIGARTLVSSTGIDNTASGDSALEFDTTGSHNTADGTDALVFNNGSNNTASGVSALYNNNGSDNTASGYGALEGNTTGNSNTALGFNACNLNPTTASNVICIGESVAGANISNSTYIAGIYRRPTTGTGNPEVCVSSDGRLGTTHCAGNAAQQQQIADLQQRLSQLESLIAKK